MEIELDRPLPNSVPVNRATAVFVVGTCFHRHRPIASLALAAGIDARPHRVIAQRMPRPDRHRQLHADLEMGTSSGSKPDFGATRDPEMRSYRSGFWAVVTIEPQPRTGPLELMVDARLANGQVERAAVATVEVVGAIASPKPAIAPISDGSPLVAVCMATFNPDIDLFRIQVESIRVQTHPNWICVISDDCSDPENFAAIEEVVAGDDRFVISRSDEHLSFYRNFERALRMIPAQAEFVALSDHDDHWYPDKLSALCAEIGSAELAFSDLRRVDVDGNVRAETLWEQRCNNYTNLASLLVSNTVPGAACMFRRRLIDYALPFPDGPGWDFHDHWLALVALSLGEIAYVDRPLYDYVQHAGAVLGRVTSGAKSGPAWSFSGFRERLAHWRGGFERWRSIYFSLYLQRVLHARVLLARCGAELTPRKRRALRWMAAAGSSPPAFAWLAVRPARALVGRTETLRVEWQLARGIAWRQLVGLLALGRTEPGARGPDASMPSVNPDSLGPRQRRWLSNR